MTDRGDEFPLRVEIVHEQVGLGVAADMIGRIAPGHDHAVELRGGNFVMGLVAVDRVSQLAGIGLPGFRSDDRYFAAGFLETVDGIPHLHLLVHLLDQNGGSFSLQFHRELLLFGLL